MPKAKQYYPKPQFKISPWRETTYYHVCSVFLYYKDQLYSSQIGLPKEMSSETARYDMVERAKEKLYNEAEAGKKGFEPIRRGGPGTIPTTTFEKEDERAKNLIQLPDEQFDPPFIP